MASGVSIRVLNNVPASVFRLSRRVTRCCFQPAPAASHADYIHTVLFSSSNSGAGCFTPRLRPRVCTCIASPVGMTSAETSSFFTLDTSLWGSGWVGMACSGLRCTGKMMLRCAATNNNAKITSVLLLDHTYRETKTQTY